MVWAKRSGKRRRPLRSLRSSLSRRSALGVGAALVRLVDDDEVPPLLPDPFPDVLLLGVVDGGDDLGVPLPGVDELLLVDGRKHHRELFAEPTLELVLPLDR